MAAEKKGVESKDSNQDGVSEEDVRKESSKVAKQATEAQKKATEFMEAAAAAGDPEERQKLMEQALEQQIQSKSLGKTAKYLRSGTFQGMAVGAGLGIAPGASLGAITGTLVGGVSSTALGGLGAGVGAATGALHGPFWDIGKGAGKGIQKITGNLPGWKATESQKKQLEKMVGQINEQDAPGKDELENWGNEGASDDQNEVLKNAKSAMPSMPVTERSEESENPEKSSGKGKLEGEAQKERSKPEGSSEDRLRETQSDEKDWKDSKREINGDLQKQDDDTEAKEAHVGREIPNETRLTYKDVAVQTEQEDRKKPRKLQTKPSNAGIAPSSKPPTARKQPRKLEKRST